MMMFRFLIYQENPSFCEFGWELMGVEMDL
jgi:hypothetical protein